MDLSNFSNQIKKINSSVKDYFEFVISLGFAGNDPYSAALVEKYIKKFDKQPPAVDSTDSTFEFYSFVFLAKKAFVEILQIFTNNKLDLYQKGSQTSSGVLLSEDTISKSINDLSDLSVAINGFFSDSRSRELSEKLSEFILSHDFNPELSKSGIYTIKNVDAIEKKYSEFYKKQVGESVVLLYRTLLQDIVDFNTGKQGGGEVIKYIMVIVEEMKTSILSGSLSQIVGTQNKKTNTVQRLIQFNGLVPATVCMPFQELIKQKLDVGCKSVSALGSAAKLLSTKEKGVGFIVIYKATDSPFEHTIFSLVDTKFISDHSMHQTIQAGVSKKAFERNKTMNQLTKKNATKDDILFFDKEHSSNKQNVYYVIESLDGETFRMMTLWGIDSQTLAVPDTWIKNIDKIDKNPSNRLGGYNECLNQEIITKLKEPSIKLEFMTRDEARRADTKWRVLREKITRDVKESFKSKIEDGKKIGNLVASSAFLNRVVLAISEKMEEDENVGLNDEFSKSELLLSYVRDLQQTKNKLESDLVEVYSARYSDRFKKADKFKSLSLFDEYMDDVLSRVVNRKSNIFLTVQYKSEILNKNINGDIRE